MENLVIQDPKVYLVWRVNLDPLGNQDLLGHLEKAYKWPQHLPENHNR